MSMRASASSSRFEATPSPLASAAGIESQKAKKTQASQAVPHLRQAAMAETVMAETAQEQTMTRAAEADLEGARRR